MQRFEWQQLTMSELTTPPKPKHLDPDIVVQILRKQLRRDYPSLPYEIRRSP